MDNLDEQILWLEEKTLSEGRDQNSLQRERLLIQVIFKMFEAFEHHVGKLHALDVLCQKNLFSYIRLKNRALSGACLIKDSKLFNIQSFYIFAIEFGTIIDFQNIAVTFFK